jgi:hypothetical protein
MRINEIMQRFSSLDNELREVETPSQDETEELVRPLTSRRK